MESPIVDVDLLLCGGTLLTGPNNAQPNAQPADAVAVKHGRIVAVGNRRDMERLPARRKIDLDGKVLAPGFIDAHNHFLLYCIARRHLDCRLGLDAEIGELLEKLETEVRTRPAGEWIKGWGFADYKVKQRRFPTLAELDAVAPSHPVAIVHASWHHAMVNSLGLRMLGIDERSAGQGSGRIERDPGTGLPTGVLHGKALKGISLDDFFKEFFALSPDEQLSAVRSGAREYAGLGITTVCDPGVSADSLAVYQHALKQDALTCRLVVMPYFEWSQALIESGLVSGFGSERLKLGAVKLLGDGSLSGRTAAVSEPYQNSAETGLLHWDQPTLDAIVQDLDARGFQIAFHAIGDRAVSQVLAAYGRVIDKNTTGNHRHRIEHAGILNPHLIHTMADMGIVVAVQPRMLFEQGDGFHRSCGEARMAFVYPYRSLIEAGIRVAGSSDCPVVSPDPILGMRDAVLRKTEMGRTLAPRERLTPRHALSMYTHEAAYSLCEEHIKGSIETGKLADMVVLSGDPLSIPPESWEDRIRVEMTIVGGEVVHSAGNAR
jgi:predicted amidohydrolase YtcJ